MRKTGLVLCFIGSLLLFLSSTHYSWITMRLMGVYIGKFYLYYYLEAIGCGFLILGFVCQVLPEFRKK